MRPPFNSRMGKIRWRWDRLPTPVFLGFPDGSAGKESAHNTRDLGLIPGLGRSPGEGNGYQLQYSRLENSMVYTVHGVTKSQIWLSDFHLIVARQAPLSIGFSRQKYWCVLPFPSPEDLPDPGIKPASPALQAVSCIAGRSFNNWATKEPQMTLLVTNYLPHHSKEMATSVLHTEYGNCGFSLCLNMGSDEEFSNSQGSFLFKKFWQQ